MSQSAKGNRFQISFKENIYEVELMNYMLEKSKLLGISTYIKLLISKDMESEKNEK